MNGEVAVVAVAAGGLALSAGMLEALLVVLAVMEERWGGRRKEGRAREARWSKVGD